MGDRSITGPMVIRTIQPVGTDIPGKSRQIHGHGKHRFQIHLHRDRHPSFPPAQRPQTVSPVSNNQPRICKRLFEIFFINVRTPYALCCNRRRRNPADNIGADHNAARTSGPNHLYFKFFVHFSNAIICGQCRTMTKTHPIITLDRTMPRQVRSIVRRCCSFVCGRLISTISAPASRSIICPWDHSSFNLGGHSPPTRGHSSRFSAISSRMSPAFNFIAS